MRPAARHATGSLSYRSGVHRGGPVHLGPCSPGGYHHTVLTVAEYQREAPGHRGPPPAWRVHGDTENGRWRGGGGNISSSGGNGRRRAPGVADPRGLCGLGAAGLLSGGSRSHEGRAGDRAIPVKQSLGRSTMTGQERCQRKSAASRAAIHPEGGPFGRSPAARGKKKKMGPGQGGRQHGSGVVAVARADQVGARQTSSTSLRRRALVASGEDLGDRVRKP